MFNIIKLQAENKTLKEELAQKEITIQYLNSCVSRANKRYTDLLVASRIGVRAIQALDFPNSSLGDRQISIHDILEN